MATVKSPGPASRVEAAPSDGFDDEPLRRPAGKTASPGVPARSVLLALAGAGAWASAALDVVPFSVASLAAAVLAGAWFNGRQLARFLPLLSAVAVVGVFFAVPAGPTRSLLAVATALLTLGFGSLGRLALAAAVTAARSHEQARRDAELLRILDDARIFRLVGRAAENDDSGMRRELGQGLAVRDGLYRLLRLGERALTPDAIALYAADAAHKELTLSLIHI